MQVWFQLSNERGSPIISATKEDLRNVSEISMFILLKIGKEHFEHLCASVKFQISNSSKQQTSDSNIKDFKDSRRETSAIYINE